MSALEHIDVRTRLFSTLIESVSLYRDHVVIMINLMDDSTDPPTPISLEKYFRPVLGMGGHCIHWTKFSLLSRSCCSMFRYQNAEINENAPRIVSTAF